VLPLQTDKILPLLEDKCARKFGAPFLRGPVQTNTSVPDRRCFLHRFNNRWSTTLARRSAGHSLL